jgi:uncharacterized membrane protein
MSTLVMLGIVKWWSGYYGNHQLISVGIRFAHLMALMLSGGTALFVDRRVFRAVRANETEKQEMLCALHSAHRLIIPWVVVLGLTGILMTAADTETFLVSKVYWIKMTVVALLGINGIALLVAERKAGDGNPKAWSRVVTASTISFLLWIGALLMGTLLTVAA